LTPGDIFVPMSSFIKISSQYFDSVNDTLESLNSIYRDRLNRALIGAKIQIKIPSGEGFLYEREVDGQIKNIQLKLSRPSIDIPMLICQIEIEGVDQFGNPYLGIIDHKKVNEKVPWENFKNFSSIDLTYKD